MASSEILSQTLSSITNIKLEQLDKQKNEYDSRKQRLLQDAADESDDRARTRILLEGAEKLPTMTSLMQNPLISLDNFKRFVQQAQHDPSIPESFIRDYETTLRNELQVQSNKYDYASLYGKLVNEWISVGKSEEVDAEAGYLPVGREEMHEQRATWEGYVFKAKDTDPAAIKAYLDDVFASDKEVARKFEDVRQKLRDLQRSWDDLAHFNEGTLSDCIEGMLRGDILTDGKRTTLKDFLGNTVVLSEIADVLNMRMSTRDSWVWDSDLIIDQRRNLNGRYRFYPDEDLLQSIFLHYIGMRWGVAIRQALEVFVGQPGVWNTDSKPISKEDTRRRQVFLGEFKHGGRRGVPSSVQDKRQRHFEEDIFLDQLPRSMGEQRGSYGSDGSEPGDSRKSHTEVVQDLLHIIEAEIIMQRRLGRDITVIRSDFKWFGPSIPHSSIYAVLEYFGINADWISLFKKVLEAPVRFKQDPADAPAQVRKRGTPLGTPLADFLGEALLFCVDFGVNRKADGTRLYRLHDDMWLWGTAEACVKSWKAVVHFANVVGLEFNVEKTGSARILRDGSVTAKVPSGLPKGHVTWGFLKLDPASGRFLIDQDEVDKHIEELRLQLSACKSVFDWTQAWNIYGSRFFTTNFGKPANCYARAHVDSMLATFQRIQQGLFPDTPGGVSEHLKEKIADRFGLKATEIPDGYLYFPVSLGGLGLQNPFINLYLIRDQVKERPDDILDNFFEQEESEYERLKRRFEEQEGAPSWTPPKVSWDEYKDAPFMSFEEYTRHRESTSVRLVDAYDFLMEQPEPRDIEWKGDVKAVLAHGEWRGLSSYEKWVVQLFHKDMIARFGGLNIVEKGLLPLGLLDMLRQSKFRWQG